MGNHGSRAVRGGWRQWTEDEARAVLADLAASGRSDAAFARSRGITPRRIAYWRERLGTGTPPAFVAVDVPATPTSATIAIETRGVVLHVREEIAVAKLVEIVDALAGRGQRC